MTDYTVDLEQHEIIHPENFNALLRHGTDLGVSDFFISSHRQIKGELHGKNEYFTKFDVTESHVSRIAELIYGSTGVAAKLIGEGIPCSYQFKHNQNTYRYRVNMIKSNRGVFIAMRPLAGIPPKLSYVGLEECLVESFVSMSDHKSDNTLGKMFVIAGETGSGKSSTISALIRYLIEESRLRSVGLNIYTAEAPIEYLYNECDDGTAVIEQIEKYKGFTTFSGAIRDFMRMDPDIIVVGETRDPETQDAILQAANTGHVAVTTIHANSISQIVTRMIDLTPGEEKSSGDIKRVLESIGVAVFQKLVPIKSGAGKKGGRVAIREYLVFDKEVREYLLDHIDNLSRATQFCVEKYGRSFDQHRQELIKEGIIDV